MRRREYSEESEQLIKKRWEIWEEKKELEETIERYKREMNNFDNWVWKQNYNNK